MEEVTLSGKHISNGLIGSADIAAAEASRLQPWQLWKVSVCVFKKRKKEGAHSFSIFIKIENNLGYVYSSSSVHIHYVYSSPSVQQTKKHFLILFSRL